MGEPENAMEAEIREATRRFCLRLIQEVQMRKETEIDGREMDVMAVSFSEGYRAALKAHPQ